MTTVFDAITAARLTKIELGSPREVNPATASDYKRIVRRLLSIGGNNVEAVLKAASSTASPATWFKHRAALVWAARRALTRLLADQDKLQRQMRLEPANDALNGQWQTLVGRLRFFSRLANQIPEGCPIPANQRRPRHSKRRVLSKLPDDWQERLLRRMGKYRLPYLVAAISGCRPSELQGAAVACLSNGRLEIRLVGKKVTKKQGQPWRLLCWDFPFEGLIRELVQEIQSGENPQIVQLDNPRNFSTAVRDAARREWPGLRQTITPYCLRHAFSSELKHGGWSKDAIAEALGHVSDATGQRYGLFQHGNGRIRPPDSVRCAREVRRVVVADRSFLASRQAPSRTRPPKMGS